MSETVTAAVGAVLAARAAVPRRRSLLVGVSGIDGSGKGYLTSAITTALRARGLAAAGIGADGWLHLPHRRFDPVRPAEHFYAHAFRFDEMFERLILPLRDRRSHRLVADYTEETATEYRKHTYAFGDTDVIVLEGIFLLKRAYRHHFDLSFWVDCTFETALERALARAQEGLPPADTARAYHEIYFPAQRIHFAKDDPRGAAGAVLPNDPRRAPSVPPGGMQITA